MLSVPALYSLSLPILRQFSFNISPILPFVYCAVNTSSKIKAKFKDGKGRWGVPYETKAGSKRRYFAKYGECKGAANPTDIVSNAAIVHRYSRTTLEARLKAKVCELCGATDSKAYEIHHVNKVKNLKGKRPWEIAMIAKRRKTLVVCKQCHYAIHHP